MKQPARITIASLAAAFLAGFLGWPAHTSGQAAGEAEAIAAAIADISLQQTKIAGNQKQMDEKIAAISEELRIARIFVSRGGGKAN